MLWHVVLMAGFLLLSRDCAVAEELTLTTYYPSPSGDYQQLHVLGNLGVGTNRPEASFEVKGHVKMLGAWRLLEADKVYQAATDGFIVAYATSPGTLLFYADANDPPEMLLLMSVGTSTMANAGGTLPVRKGDYWRVKSIDANPLVRWFPLGG